MNSYMPPGVGSGPSNPHFGAQGHGPAGIPSLPQKKRKILPVVLVGMLVLGIGAGAIFALFRNVQSPMELAYENCNGTKALDRMMQQSILDNDLEISDDIELIKPIEDSLRQSDTPTSIAEIFDGVLSIEDKGQTLIIETKGQEENDILLLSRYTYECVYIDLETPKSVQQAVLQTRAMDGRQTAEWDNYKAQWSYHPDSGLSMIITTKQ